MGCTSSISRSISRSFSTYTFYPTNPVFGVPLINVVCSDKSPYVAKVVVECAEFLERDENITKNIYCSLRKLSDQKSIDKLKQKVFEVECTRRTIGNYLIRFPRFTWMANTMRSNVRMRMWWLMCCCNFSKSSDQVLFTRKISRRHLTNRPVIR